jgi:MFS family permease
MENSRTTTKPFIIAWALGLLFYFLEYAIRSSPAVMITELSHAFDVNAVGVGSVAGMYYYTYSVTSLIAGIALDRAGAKYSLSIGTVIVGIGCLLFSVSHLYAGNAGRLLQGMGSAFAFPGCVYLASRGFSPRSLATAIGATQCLGMLGGSAGQFVVGPLLRNGMQVSTFWIGIGVISLLVGIILFIVTPLEKSAKSTDHPTGKTGLLSPYKIVFTNRQSYLCGLISGLLFAPTTIFAMTWGVAFFQKDRMLDYQTATLASSMVPMGWVFGCPLLGWLSDVTGKRKPVLIGGAAIMVISFLQMLFLPQLFPIYVSTFILGVASGVAMIPYSIIKESNPDEVKGSATGAINFLTFGVTALLGPLFSVLYGKTLATNTNLEGHFQSAGTFWIIGIGLAIVLSLLLHETGQGRTLTIKK